MRDDGGGSENYEQCADHLHLIPVKSLPQYHWHNNTDFLTFLLPQQQQQSIEGNFGILLINFRTSMEKFSVSVVTAIFQMKSEGKVNL